MHESSQVSDGLLVIIMAPLFDVCQHSWNPQYQLLDVHCITITTKPKILEDGLLPCRPSGIW